MRNLLLGILLILVQGPLAGATPGGGEGENPPLIGAMTISAVRTYVVNVESGGKKAKITVSEAEYRLLKVLERLWADEFFDPKGDHFEFRNLRGVNIWNLVQSINRNGNSRLGGDLILSSEEGIRLNRPYLDSATILFQIAANGVIYRGERVALSAKEIAIVTALSEAKDRSMTIQELATAVGWKGRNFRTNVNEIVRAINLKAVFRTGAKLLRKTSQTVSLEVVEPRVYSSNVYSSQNWGLINIENGVFDEAMVAVAEVLLLGGDLAAPLPPLPENNQLNIDGADFEALNMVPKLFVASVRDFFQILGRDHGMITIHVGVEGNTLRYYLNGSEPYLIPRARRNSGPGCNVII